MVSLVMTLIGADRPGLVESLAATVAAHDANWLESRMSHLAGQFAGILRVEVEKDKAETLVEALRKLDAQGLRVLVEQNDDPTDDPFTTLQLDLVGNDRPGIVREISHALAEHGVNVEDFKTECISAPMSGEKLFQATAMLRLPAGLTVQELQQRLEQIAHDLVVDIELH